MSTSGACIINKLSGILYIREDVTPSILEWKAVDQPTNIKVNLQSIVNLQATKDTSQKMIIKVIYKNEEKEEDLRLTFTNRHNMNTIKESLQTIISRQRTTIDSSIPQPTITTSTISLSDESLLKNRDLQQKLLNEDRVLRNIFTQSIINFKLSPLVFWSSRLNLLRTFALTINQRRGPYNVLSTIKPVATSDNKVNVNVTRDNINEMFSTYPIIKKAFDELVPKKFQEGEFWSRFFNSKLFRRLRGDKIQSGDRGDIVLDQYMQELIPLPEISEVNKFIDLNGNLLDNSTKLGNKPDFTMDYKETLENSEMMILLRNMNNLSSKMVNLSDSKTQNDHHASKEFEQGVKELELDDLKETTSSHYIDLKINPPDSTTIHEITNADSKTLKLYLHANLISETPGGVNLIDTYSSKQSINDTASNITNLIKSNFKHYKLIHSKKSGEKLDEEYLQKFIDLNVTIVEFLSHFWSLYLNGDNPNQLKKLFNLLKNCKSNLNTLKQDCAVKFNQNEKLVNDLNYYLSPISNSLDKALYEYVKAIKAENEVNEFGKRPAEDPAIEPV